MIPHLYEDSVVLFSVIEFVFGTVERGMTESEPSLGDI